MSWEYDITIICCLCLFLCAKNASEVRIVRYVISYAIHTNFQGFLYFVRTNGRASEIKDCYIKYSTNLQCSTDCLPIWFVSMDSFFFSFVQKWVLQILRSWEISRARCKSKSNCRKSNASLKWIKFSWACSIYSLNGGIDRGQHIIYVYMFYALVSVSLLLFFRRGVKVSKK